MTHPHSAQLFLGPDSDRRFLTFGLEATLIRGVPKPFLTIDSTRAALACKFWREAHRRRRNPNPWRGKPRTAAQGPVTNRVMGRLRPKSVSAAEIEPAMPTTI